MKKCATQTGEGVAEGALGCTSAFAVAGATPSLFPDDCPATKPFMWWVGAKTKLLPYIARFLPATIADLYEPFCGCAAVSLGIAPRVRGKIHLSDLRWDVVAVMNLLREGGEGKLISRLQFHEDRHCNGHFDFVLCALNDGFATAENSAKTGSVSDEWLADFFYINQTCFGACLTLAADGKGYKGSYAPGRMSDKFICREGRILRGAKILQQKATPALVQDFCAIEPKRGDLVYCDPPYDAKNVYGKASRKDKTYTIAPELADAAARWRRAGAKVMVSLNDSDAVRQTFGSAWRVVELKKQYLINNITHDHKEYTAEVLLLSW